MNKKVYKYSRYEINNKLKDLLTEYADVSDSNWNDYLTEIFSVRLDLLATVDKPTTKCSCCNSDCLDLEVNPCGEIEEIKELKETLSNISTDQGNTTQLIRLQTSMMIKILEKLNQIK